MPTPYEPRSAEAVTATPRLMRPREGRWLAGVCQGLAVHLGLPVMAVRAVMVALTVAGGAGVAAYAFLWALTPAAPSRAYAALFAGGAPGLPSGLPPGLPPVEDAWTEKDGRGISLFVLGGFLALVGGLVAAQNAGLDVNAGTVIPLLVIGGGAILAWSQLDDTQRSTWLGTGQRDRRTTLLRVLAGLLLTLTGIIVLVTRGQSLASLWDALLATLAVLAGAALIATPWIVRLWSDLRAEQVAAARATERADIAAHLHDSVLQTLALIQRRAEDPTAVAQLARAQERELRSWLYAGPAGGEETLSAALTAAAHDVEDSQGVPVELVVTGDGPIDPGGLALGQAFREALLNATRHGRPPVTAYVEVGADRVEAFVRDRGDGFDLEDVPADRLGVRESILGRMERVGGSAAVRRLDDGTEVCLTLPLPQGVPT